MTHWESRTVREKEILVDVNCNECRDVSSCITDANYPAESEPHFNNRKTGQFSPVSETKGKKRTTATGTRENGSYKEVLEKGMKESSKLVLEKGMREGGGGKNYSLEGDSKMIDINAEDDEHIGKESYKEVLEKGRREEGGGGKEESLEVENKMIDVKTEDDGHIGEESRKEVLEREICDKGEGGKKDRLEGENKMIDVKTKDEGQIGEEFAADPILELFESVWLKKPASGKRETLLHDLSLIHS